jgi:acetyl-CoA synthetase
VILSNQTKLKLAENDFGSLGDTSTLADPEVVENLIQNRES